MMIPLVIVLVISAHILADCPSGEYNPGPDCSFEVICARPSAHTARRHYCDCWCNPGTMRDTETNTCVEKCPDLFREPGLSATESYLQNVIVEDE